MASLSWAKTRAAGLGCSATPSASSAASTSAGTCSWSNVTTSQSRANARTASRSAWLPDRRGRDDSAADGVRRLGQHGEGDRQPDGRWLAHPGQLATADDADDGEPPGARCGDVTARRLPVRRYDAHSRRAYPEAVAPAHPSLLRPCPRRDGRARARDGQVRGRRRGRVRRRHRRVQPAAVRLRRGHAGRAAAAGQGHLGDRWRR